MPPSRITRKYFMALLALTSIFLTAALLIHSFSIGEDRYAYLTSHSQRPNGNKRLQEMRRRLPPGKRNANNGQARLDAIKARHDAAVDKKLHGAEYMRRKKQQEAQDRAERLQTLLTLHGQNYHKQSYSVLLQPIGTALPMTLAIYSHDTIEGANRRNALRLTWTQSTQDYNTTLVFVLGVNQARSNMAARLRHEHSSHDDLLQFDMIDSYQNLTVKSVQLLRWFVNSGAEILIKCDDDVLVNMENLAFYIQNLRQNSTTFIAGHINHNNLPNRDHKSKWYLPNALYQDGTLPDFAAGPTYLLSHSAAKAVLEAALISDFLYLEDVFITGLCARRGNVTLVHSNAFLKSLSPGTVLTDAWRDIISLHGISQKNIMHLWSQLDHCSLVKV